MVADQSFDSMSRAWVYDAEQDWEKSMDELQMVFMAQTYGQSVDELWVPRNLLWHFMGCLVSTNTLDIGPKI